MRKEIGPSDFKRRAGEAHDFVHTAAKKFDFFPFICGYMRKEL